MGLGTGLGSDLTKFSICRIWKVSCSGEENVFIKLSIVIKWGYGWISTIGRI